MVITPSRSTPHMEPPAAIQEPRPLAAATGPETLDDQDKTEEALPTYGHVPRVPGPWVRSAAIKRREDAGGGARPLTQVALTDTIPQLRMEVLELLAETDTQAAVDTLQQALRDPDPRVRALAQTCLRKCRKHVRNN